MMSVCLKFLRHELYLNTVLGVGSLCCLTLEQFKVSTYSYSGDGMIQQQCLLSACYAADYAERPEQVTTLG